MLLCCFLLSFTCSAADDLSDEGYLWDSEGGFWYIPKSEAADEETTNLRSGPLRAPAASGTGTTIAFPDFDKNKIDVAGFPDYVKAMLASPTSFTVLVVTSDKFYLWVADCCILTVSGANGRLFIIDLAKTNVLNQTNKYIWPDAKGDFSIAPSTFGCYTAIYSWSASSDLYSLSTPWSVASSNSLARYTFDTTPKETDSVLLRYSTRNFSSVTSDAFVFGNNAVYRTDYSSILFPVKAGTFFYFPGTWSERVDSYNNRIIIGDSDSNLRLIDGGTFPTAESQQAETQRGILGQLKALPDKIKAFFDGLFDKIKGLFIPSDGFFDTYFNDLKSFFAERFGFLYDLPAAAVTIFNQLVSFKPAESGYHIHFPEVSAPVIIEGISGVGWQRIIPEQDYYFDFLDKAPFSTLYSGYRAFIWLAYCFMLVNLAKSKADSILGGK